MIFLGFFASSFDKNKKRIRFDSDLNAVNKKKTIELSIAVLMIVFISSKTDSSYVRTFDKKFKMGELYFCLSLL